MDQSPHGTGQLTGRLPTAHGTCVPGDRGEKIYVDNITVLSETWEEHLKTLRQIFYRLKDSGLKVKFAKCVWAAAECRVLGSIVSKEGIRPEITHSTRESTSSYVSVACKSAATI